MHHIYSVPEGVGINPVSDLSPTITSECSLESSHEDTSYLDDTPHKLVDMALVFGGMDTSGEIFDDVLVYMLREQPESEQAEGGGERSVENSHDGV